MITEIIILLLRVLANGFFALSEFVVISAKRAFLHQRAEKGDVRSRIALEVAEEPTWFLSTIQVGITPVGILAGAFGGATIATEIAGSVESIPARGIAPCGMDCSSRSWIRMGIGWTKCWSPNCVGCRDEDSMFDQAFQRCSHAVQE